MEQKELVSKIYSVHEELRRKKREREGKDWQLIWKEHTQNFSRLQEYAQAMQVLATKIWEPRNVNRSSAESKTDDTSADSYNSEFKCRLDWVHSKCNEYYFKQEPGSIIKERKLKLLDVGSCFNPFKKFGNFYDITAIDLCPAPGFAQEVYQCDFLDLKISTKVEIISNLEGSRKLISLNRNSFDVVVFSFFLEYLPDKKQRLESCRKASDLLKHDGLLFILRPDSSSVTPTGNSKLVKALKVGNALLGLKRIFFEKLPHLWCMGFVKLNDEDKEKYITSLRFLKDLNKVENSMNIKVHEDSLEELFSISQDFKNIELDSDIHPVSDSEKALPELFNELPEFDFV